MRKFGASTFYCFSPLVMFATFAIEIGMLIYILVRYHMSTLTRLITGALLLLATFQFAEYHVCTDINGTSSFYSRLGFMAITMLPPIGIHLVHAISGRGSEKLVALAYASGIGFAVTFGFNSAAFQGYACSGNYAVFQLTERLGGMYFIYYYFWLLIGILQCLKFSIDATKRIRTVLTYQTFGYLSFILPTGIVNAVNPDTIDAIPSIMCGFAAIYAIILTFGITPLVLKQKAIDSAKQAN